MRIIEIFNSIDGEVTGWGQGAPSTFIRFAGCNLKCSFCDTPTSRDRERGQVLTLSQLFKTVDKMSDCRQITITGGEPLLQGDVVVKIIQKYINKRITVETNGTIDPKPFMDNHVSIVVDYKLPSAKCQPPNLSHYLNLRTQDVIKFPLRVDSPKDYQTVESFVTFLRSQMQKCWGTARPILAISPIFDRAKKVDLIGVKKITEWECFRREGFILSVQLHKLIGVK